MTESGLSAAERALSRAAEKVAGCKVDLVKLSTKMDGQMEELRAQWGGEGAAAFQNLKRAWLDRQKTINDALDVFEQSLIETEKDNVATDQQAGSTMGALASRLTH